MPKLSIRPTPHKKIYQMSKSINEELERGKIDHQLSVPYRLNTGDLRQNKKKLMFTNLHINIDLENTKKREKLN